MIFVRVEREGYGWCIYAPDNLGNFIEEIAEDVKEIAWEKAVPIPADVNEYKWTVTFVEMTQEEFDALPEFDGY